MSLVARGLAISPAYLVDTAVFGFTVKAVIPPPPTTAPPDPFAKVANTQVIRESHLRKHLRLKKRKEVERVDLDTQQVVAAGIVPTSVQPKSARSITGLKDENSALLSALHTSWRVEDVRALRSAAIALTHLIIDEDE